MGKNQCTMKDVAQVVGVSTYTVSRALNGKKDISDKLRERILRTAHEMGYVPNIAARGLQSGRTKTIAVVLDDLQNMYYNILLSKFTRKLNAKGYHIIIYYEWDSINTLNENLMQRVLSSNPDGIISFLRVDKDALELNKIWKRPLAVIGAEEDDPQIDCVFFNDLEGGKMVTEYLIERGCRKIGFINASSKLLPGVRRGTGYCNALKEHGIPVDERLMIHLEDSNLTVEEAVCRLCGEYGADGIFCYNDMSALAVLRTLMSSPYKDAVLVAGWDNTGKEIKLPCRLTTVGVDFDSMVDDIITVLTERMEGDGEVNVLKKMYSVYLVKDEA